jgi:hypothetical protein
MPLILLFKYLEVSYSNVPVQPDRLAQLPIAAVYDRRPVLIPVVIPRRYRNA